MDGSSNRWLALGLLFLIGLTGPMHFQSVAALAPFLIAHQGLSYTDIGILTGVFMLPGIFFAAPSGVLAAWLGDRLTLLIGIVMMGAAALVFAATDAYHVMLACRVIGGAGAVAITVLLPKVVTDWFAGKEIATGLSIIASSVGFGMGLTVAILPWIASQTSWQVAMIANAAFSAVGIALLLAIYPKQAPRPDQPAGSGTLWLINRKELVLSSLAGLGRGLFSAGYVVFISFVPPLLIAQGLAPAEAGLLTSIAALMSLVSVPLGGLLSDWTRKPNLFIVGGSLGTALTCILVPYVAPAVLWVVLFGVLRGGCTGGLMALPSQILRPQSRTTGFAIVSAVYFICMTCLPAVAGYLLDATGSRAAPLWFAALLWLLITAQLGLFKALQHGWKCRANLLRAPSARPRRGA